MAAMPAVEVGGDPPLQKKARGHFVSQEKLNADLEDERSKYRAACTLKALYKLFKEGDKSDLVSKKARRYAQDNFGSDSEYADLRNIHTQFSPAQANNLAWYLGEYFATLYCTVMPFYKDRMLLADVGKWPQLLGFHPEFVHRYWHVMKDCEKKASLAVPILQGEEHRGTKWEQCKHDPSVKQYKNLYMHAILARHKEANFDFLPCAAKLSKTASQDQKDDASYTAKYIKMSWEYFLWQPEDPRGGRYIGHSHYHGKPIKLQMCVEQEDGRTQWWRLQNTGPTYKEGPTKVCTSTPEELQAFCRPFVPPPDASKLLLNEVSRAAIAKHVAHMDVPKLSSSTADKKPVLSAEENKAAVQQQMQKAIELRRAAQKQAADGHGLPGGVHVPKRMTMDMMDEVRENMKIARQRKADKETNASAAGGGSAGTGGSAGQGSGWGGRSSSGGGSAACGGPAPGGPL